MCLVAFWTLFFRILLPFVVLLTIFYIVPSCIEISLRINVFCCREIQMGLRNTCTFSYISVACTIVHFIVDKHSFHYCRIYGAILSHMTLNIVYTSYNASNSNPDDV